MNEPMGQPNRITLHWTASGYSQVFGDYHGCIKGDGVRVATRPLTVKGVHTWGRNSGNIGESLCGMAKGCPIKPVQIETMAATVAEHAARYGIALRGVVKLPKMKVQGGVLVPVPGQWILAPTVADHAWYAKADGYFPDRWDIGDLYHEVLEKAVWYHEQLRLGRRQFQHTGPRR